MGNLHNLLVKRYAEHYARVNVNIDPEKISPINLRGMSLMYGDLINSLPAGSKVLDLGCGTGFLLYWLSMQPGIIPYGVDMSPTQVEIATRALPSLDISCSDGLEYLQENRETFSGIFCLDVIEHIEDNDLCLKWLEAAHAALKPGGFFYCRAPNAANLTGCQGRYIDLTHHRIFTSATIIQLLEVGGFIDCRIVPLLAPHLSGRLRLAIEFLLHKVIFRICGAGLEQVFTRNVNAVGFKK